MPWLIPALVLAGTAAFAPDAVAEVRGTPTAGAAAIVRVLNSRSAGSRDSYESAARQIAAEASKGAPLQQFVLALVAGFDEPPEAAAELAPARRREYLDANRDKIRQLAEKRGNPLAWYILSIEKNDLGLLRRAADGGNVQAQNALASIELSEALRDRAAGRDEGVEDRLRGAFGRFRMAAGSGDGNALCNLGLCILNGYGCRKDQTRAFTCFRLAAQRGHVEAMDHLSVCYDTGRGCEASAVEAMVWKLRARAAVGDRAAAEWLRANGR